MDTKGRKEDHNKNTGTSLELMDDARRIRPETLVGDLFDAATHTLSMVPFAITQAHWLMRISFFLKRSQKDDDYQDRGDLG